MSDLFLTSTITCPTTATLSDAGTTDSLAKGTCLSFVSFQLKYLATKVERFPLKVGARILRSHAKNLPRKDKDIGSDIAFLVQMNKMSTSHSI